MPVDKIKELSKKANEQYEEYLKTIAELEAETKEYPFNDYGEVIELLGDGNGTLVTRIDLCGRLIDEGKIEDY